MARVADYLRTVTRGTIQPDLSPKRLPPPPPRRAVQRTVQAPALQPNVSPPKTEHNPLVSRGDAHAARCTLLAEGWVGRLDGLRSGQQ